MIEVINRQIVANLQGDPVMKMKVEGEYLRGHCPECGKKTFWTWLNKPGQLQCNRENNCSYKVTSKELYPEFFENFNKNYVPTPEDPKKTANAYISIKRGFPLEKVKDWYEQASYWNPKADKGTATVRFWLNKEKGVYWEKFVENVTITDDNGKQEKRDSSFGGASKGLYWQPPGQTIEKGDKVYICEGIFKAIALILKGHKALSIMSCGSFPENMLEEHKDKDILWILALDNDKAGRKFTKKHVKTIREAGQRVSCMLSSDNNKKLDWDDLYKLDRLEKEHIRLYRYYGKLEIAETALEKASIIYLKWNKNYFCFDFENSTFALEIDSNDYQEEYAKLEEKHPAEPSYCEQEAFYRSASLKSIATFALEFLYFQQPQNGETGQNFFKIHFANKSPSINEPFAGCVLSTASDFKKAIRRVSPSAIFKGKTHHLDYLSEQWQRKAPDVVSTIDYLGFDRVNKVYVYEDFAVEGCTIHKVNDQSFFNLKNSTVKTIHSLPASMAHQLTTTAPVEWLNDYRTAYSTKGLMILCWWVGTLFVQQIRARQRSYPFMEIFGEAGSGKSDMIDFLFKLYGLHNMSFNPSRAFTSAAGLTRKTSELANMPIVFSETENDNYSRDKHAEQFDWARFLDFYEGRNGVAKGIATQDNKTRQPEFKAALMAVQNPKITGAEAIVTRFVTVNFDRSHHRDEGRMASDRLKALEIKAVSGFLLHAVSKADAFLKRYHDGYEKYRQQLAGMKDIRMQRITHCHAQMMAIADCLPLLLPVTDVDITNIHDGLLNLAKEKQNTINQDHEVVQQFWANFDYMNTLVNESTGFTQPDRLNHSNTPEAEIAVNLEDFVSRCADYKLPMLSTADLRKHLPSSRSRKFVETKSVFSRLQKKTLRCWIFKHGSK